MNFIRGVILSCLASSMLFAATVPAKVKLYPKTEQPAAIPLNLYRGETVDLEVYYTSYSSPLDLSAVYNVELWYQPATWTNSLHYSVTGSVVSATGGIVRIPWTPAAEATNGIYRYNVVLQASGGVMPRCAGTIRLLGTVSGTVTNTPELIQGLVDWSSITHLNQDQAPFLSDADMSDFNTRVAAVETGKVSRGEWIDTNAAIRADIASASTLAGDLSGVTTNALVVAVRGIPVGELQGTSTNDGFGLKYDHASGSMILGPVASSSGSVVSNLLTLTGSNVATNVSFGAIGMYRSIRPGSIPTMVLNVGGFEIAYLDLMGITMRSGSLNLLGDSMSVNIAAYDGSVSAPAYSWSADRDLGKIRRSYAGDYGEGYCVSTNEVWFWANDGIHLSSSSKRLDMAGGVLTNAVVPAPAASNSPVPRYYADAVASNAAAPKVAISGGTASNLTVGTSLDLSGGGSTVPLRWNVNGYWNTLRPSDLNDDAYDFLLPPRSGTLVVDSDLNAYLPRDGGVASNFIAFSQLVINGGAYEPILKWVQNGGYTNTLRPQNTDDTADYILPAGGGYLALRADVIAATNVQPSVGFLSITNSRTYNLTTSYQQITNWLVRATNAIAGTSSNLTVTVPGWYDLAFQVSFDGTASSPHYEFELYTNGIAVDDVSFERDTSSTLTGSGSAVGAMYLPAGAVLDIRAKADSSQSATILKAQFKAHLIR